MSTAAPAAPAPADDRTTSPRPRLALRSPGSHRGAVDGGWWPREATGEELSALATAVAPDFEPVVRIAVDMHTWPGTPRRLGDLRVDGFRTWDPGTVRLVGREGRVLDLLVIAPDTNDDVATKALAAASDDDDLRPVSELLGR